MIKLGQIVHRDPDVLNGTAVFVGTRVPIRSLFDLYGAFSVKLYFWFGAGSLFGAGKPFFVPSPAIRFAERAEGVKGPKR